MNTGKFIVFAAFAAAAILLFTTDKGKEIREELSDAAEDWGDKFSELAEKATCTAKDLQKLVAKEVAGLTDDARERIAAIIEEGTKSAKKLKKVSAAQMN
jgi:gas vesicle protein